MLQIQKKMSNSFFALLSLPATAMGFALSVQISALSWILHTKYGLDIEQIGIVWAAGPIAGILAQPIVGAVSDKLWFMGGRRRPWIFIGGLLAGLMLLALPNLGIIQHLFCGADAATGLLTIAVVVALTLDLSINVSFNPTRSLVADCTTIADRSKGYTWMQTVSGTFGVMAYLIAVIWGNEVLIYVGMILVLLFTILPMFFIEEPRELEQTEETKQEGSKSVKDVITSLIPLSGFLLYGIYVIVAKLFGIPDNSSVSFFGFFSLSIMEWICVAIELISIVIVLFNITRDNKNSNEFQKVLLAHSFTWWGVQTMNVYMFFYVSTKIAGLDAGQMQTVNSLAFLVRDLIGAILPVLVLNVIARKTGMTRTHTWAIIIMAIGYGLIYLFGQSVGVFFAAMCVVGIGWASLVSLPFAIMSEKVDQAKMGLYMGIFNLAVVLPQLVASFKMGEIINNSDDKSIIFAICTICLAISGALWFSVKNDKAK